jgi:hypothetical protein
MAQLKMLQTYFDRVNQLNFQARFGLEELH